MRPALGPVALALIVGCSSRPAPVPPSPAPTAAAVPVASVPESPPLLVEEAPQARPAEIHEPTDVACRIAGVGWRSDQLRLRAGGPRFARADCVAASVILPVVTKPTEAIAVMDDGRVLLRAVLGLADVELYSPKPTALLGIVTPKSRTGLAWASSTQGNVRIGLPLDSVLRSPRPLEASVPCVGLAIVRASYDARASITKTKQLPVRQVASDAPIASTPNGRPVGVLNQGILVEVVETRSGQARILIDDWSYIVSGWVSQKELAPPLVGMGGGGSGEGGERMDKINQLHLMHCPSDVSFFVELDSERAKVGLIHKDAGFRVKPEPETDDKSAKVVQTYREVDFPDSQWLLMEKGTRLLVEASDLRACRQDSPRF